MTPKEALIKDGFPGVKAGKGRLSLAAIERCKELAASGVDIAGYQVTRAVAATSTAPVVVNKVAATNEKVIADLPDMRFDPKMYKAVSKIAVFGTTEFGMKEVCRCGNSLAYHLCDRPFILGVPVEIVPK